MEFHTAADVALAIFVAGAIFQSGRLSARVDGNTKDIDNLARAVRELTRDVNKRLRGNLDETEA